MVEIKILECPSTQELTDAINEHFEMEWKLSAGMYQAMPLSDGSSKYSVLMIRTHVPSETRSQYDDDE